MTERHINVIAIIMMLLGLSAAFANENEPRTLVSHGRALAEGMCEQCHAIGESGSSSHAAAPAFRTLSRRVDLDGFSDRLRDGLISGHPDMPTFRFTREDARALTAYLRSIQSP